MNSQHKLTVFNGAVLNLTSYLSASTLNIPNLDNILRKSVGSDSTHAVSTSYSYLKGADCLMNTQLVGFLDRETFGCIANRAIQTIILLIILSIIIIRFAMAIIFHWFISPRLVRRKSHRRHSFHNEIQQDPKKTYSAQLSKNIGLKTGNPLDPYNILLVTCYSEGPTGIKSTLESLASTDYPDSHKLLFVVADGLITGSGNSISTPDAIIQLISLHESFADPQRVSYLAVANGSKQHNMAKVVSQTTII